MQAIGREITSPVLLCRPDGTLNPEAQGWSRHPLHTCNLAGRFLRKKRWDYWCITNDRWLFSATISNLDYAAAGFVYALDFESKEFGETIEIVPFGKNAMPDRVDASQSFRRGGVQIDVENAGSSVRLAVKAAKVGGLPLQADILISRPAELESLNVVVPWDNRTFQFTSKQHCMPAEGRVTWGAHTFDFSAKDSFACLDYGRGIWPFSTSWNWAAFSTRWGSDILGVNMGARWTDGTGANENGIILNGVLHKIAGDLRFEYDAKDLMKKWRITSIDSDEIDLEFTPFFRRVADTNLLLVRTNVSQMIGHFRGTVRAGGREIAVDGAAGWAEEHFARW